MVKSIQTRGLTWTVAFFASHWYRSTTLSINCWRGITLCMDLSKLIDILDFISFFLHISLDF